MEPVQAVLAVALAVALALGPGLLVLGGLRPGAGLVRNAAVAPAISLGIFWITATALGLVHLPVSAATVLTISFALPLVALVLSRRRGGAVRGSGLRVDRWDVAGIVTGLVLAGVLWVSASQWLRLGVPNDDGSHHGFYTARILVTSSLDPQQVLVGDVLTGTPTYDFYPLAIHLMAAIIASTGLPIAVALNATWMTLVSLGLGLGMYALARRTFPDARRAAIAVAVLAPVMPQLPVRADVLGWRAAHRRHGAHARCRGCRGRQRDAMPAPTRQRARGRCSGGARGDGSVLRPHHRDHHGGAAHRLPRPRLATRSPGLARRWCAGRAS